MMNQGAAWWSYIRYDAEQDRPKVSRALLRRVAGYARPYTGRIALMLSTIIGISVLSVIPPLLYRNLIDVAIPQKDLPRLNWLALGMIAVPVGSGLLGVLQRYLGSKIGEGVIYDLRCALFQHLQRMSLRFFTNTHTGELMSRLNNDVVGSQRAISGTLVDIISNAITLAITLVVMLSLDSLTNARVDFATSMVSFERVFEVLDLPIEIQQKPGAVALDSVRGRVTFDDVSFSYLAGENTPSGTAASLSEVVRWGQAPAATLSLTARRARGNGKSGDG